MEITTFNFTAERKQASALGMENYAFFYGSIDGVEVGSPCDSEAESLADVQNVLTREKPYRLEEYLQDEVDWYESALRRNKQEPVKGMLTCGLLLRRQLLEKVLAFKTSKTQ